MQAQDSPTITNIRLDSFHPELMDETVSGGMLDHTQLAKGRFVASLLRADLGESHLDSGSYNLPLLASGEMPRDRVTLGFILRSGDTGVLNGAEVRDATPVILSEQAELNYRLAPDTRWLGFQIERSVLEATGVSLPPKDTWLPAAGAETIEELQKGLSTALSLLGQIEQHSDDILNPGILATSLQEGILSLFCGVMQSDTPGPPISVPIGKNLKNLVHTASEYMEAQMTQPIRIAPLCLATGVAWKTLQRAFVKVYGVSPKRYLTLRRLTRARRRLLTGSPATDSVTAIAVDCGFYHAGRFSIAYRELFGERPSETLASRPLRR